MIIPVWHESHQIVDCIRHVFDVAARENTTEFEIIVVDGAPQADTMRVVEAMKNSGGDSSEECKQEQYVMRNCLRSIHSKQGRAVQMNAGSHQARFNTLLFLHADTRLPYGAFSAIFHALDTDEAGAFRLQIAGPDIGEDDSSSRYSVHGVLLKSYLRVIASLANWRNNVLTRTPYGDQALFFRTQYFRVLGGFSALPIMEDVDIMRRIRRRGDDIAILPLSVSTSARRWQREGPVFCSLRNLVLRTLFAAGVSAQTLSRWYRAYKERQ